MPDRLITLFTRVLLRIYLKRDNKSYTVGRSLLFREEGIKNEDKKQQRSDPICRQGK